MFPVSEHKPPVDWNSYYSFLSYVEWFCVLLLPISYLYTCIALFVLFCCSWLIKWRSFRRSFNWRSFTGIGTESEQGALEWNPYDSIISPYIKTDARSVVNKYWWWFTSVCTSYARYHAHYLDNNNCAPSFLRSLCEFWGDYFWPMYSSF